MKKTLHNKHSVAKSMQYSFANSARTNLSYGGILRDKSNGRGQRPLSSKAPIHLVFKVNSFNLRQLSLRSVQTHRLTLLIIRKYAFKFHIKIEQFSIQNDHIHILIRTTRRSLYQHFFRVVAGQMAQQFQKEGLLQRRDQRHRNQPNQNDMTDTPAKGAANVADTTPKLWKYRPFTRVVKGWKAYKIVRNYIQLNEKEVLGVIPYRKERLRGLSLRDWQILWS